MKKAQTYNVIGKAELRNDGAEKVTGKALYTVDVDLPGMAHGKILRSPYAHARLLARRWQQGGTSCRESSP